MSESNRPPHGASLAQSEGQAAGATRSRVRRTKRLRVPVDDVPRLSERPPRLGAPGSNPPAAASIPPAAALPSPASLAPASRTEADTVKLRTVPPPDASVNISQSVVVAGAPVVVGTPSRPPPAMAAATEQMHKETHASILPPPVAATALDGAGARARSDRPPRVVLDDSEDTLVEVPISVGATTRSRPPPAQGSTESTTKPAPESVPPARLDDEDLTDATEEDLKNPNAIAATLPAVTGRVSMPGVAPPPPPVRVSAPPPVPPTLGAPETPTVVRLPPRPQVSPSTPQAQQPVAAEATSADAQKKKKKKPWWEDFFNDDFLRTVRPPSAEQVSRQCDFLEKSLGLLRGAMILDVGCGLGLQAIELAARGYNVVGLDLSLPMLSRAADEAQDRGMKINFLHSDMKDMGFEGSFDAVLCLGTTFGYFDDDTNRQVLERFRRALKPHGILLLDAVNRDYVVKDQPNLVWFEGDGCVCMEETQFNFITSRLHVKRTMILEDRDQKESEYSVRLYPLHEIGQIMHNMGFRVTQVSGMEATPGVYFGAASPRLILLAERRPEGPMTGDMPKPPLPDEKTTPQAKRRSEPPNDNGGGEK